MGFLHVTWYWFLLTCSLQTAFSQDFSNSSLPLLRARSPKSSQVCVSNIYVHIVSSELDSPKRNHLRFCMTKSRKMRSLTCSREIDVPKILEKDMCLHVPCVHLETVTVQASDWQHQRSSERDAPPPVSGHGRHNPFGPNPLEGSNVSIRSEGEGYRRVLTNP